MENKLESLRQSSHLFGSNAPFIETYYEAWLEDPASVPQQWAQEFSALNNGLAEFGERNSVALNFKFCELGSDYGRDLEPDDVRSAIWDRQSKWGVDSERLLIVWPEIQ